MQSLHDGGVGDELGEGGLELDGLDVDDSVGVEEEILELLYLDHGRLEGRNVLDVSHGLGAVDGGLGESAAGASGAVVAALAVDGLAAAGK